LYQITGIDVKTEKKVYVMGEIVTLWCCEDPKANETVSLNVYGTAGSVSDCYVIIMLDESCHFVRDKLYLFDAYRQAGTYEIFGNACKSVFIVRIWSYSTA
jgi:hypothetical protein